MRLSGPQPRPGPGLLRGGGLERHSRCRAQPGGCPGAGGHTGFQHPRPPRHWSRAAPVHTHPGAGSFFPRFPPLEQRRRKGSCSLASPDAGGSCAAAAAGAEPSVPGSRAPLPKPGTAPRCSQDSGSREPHPWRPSLALTSSRGAPAPAQRAESRGSRVGAGGLTDSGRRRRVAVAAAARVLAGRNGSRSTSLRSCSPPSPRSCSSSAAASRQPREDARRGKSVLQPVSRRGYARRGSHRGGGGSGSIAPALSPQPRRPRGWAGSGLRARAPGGGCAQARQPPGLPAGAAGPGPGLELQRGPRRRGRRRRRGGWRGRGAGTMLPSGSLRSGYRLL